MYEELGAGIQLLVLDVDGVMTDGRICIDARGEESKVFHARDGLGLKFLMAGGVEVAIITGRSSGSVIHRARDLGITELHQGVIEKGPVFRKLIRERGLGKDQVCCIGDDLLDLPMFRESGLGMAPADAVPEVRDAADMVLRAKGGHGAVREVCEWILKCKGKWGAVVAAYAED